MTQVKSKVNRDAHLSLDTAGRIVAEARRLFAEKGYDGVSIKEISETAGVNIAAVNYHFESKENLFRHIIEQFISETMIFSRKTLLPPHNAEELKVRLEVFIRQMLEAMISQPEVIYIMQRETERSDHVIQKTVIKNRTALFEFLTQAKNQGLLAGDVDPSFAAESLMAQVSYARRKVRMGKDLFGHSPSDEKYREQWIQQTLRMFFGGIMAK